MIKPSRFWDKQGGNHDIWSNFGRGYRQQNGKCGENRNSFLTIGDKPIIIHTIEKFYVNSRFEKIIVLCPNQWINHTKNLIKKDFKNTERIVVIEGGETRNENHHEFHPLH